MNLEDDLVPDVVRIAHPFKETENLYVVASHILIVSGIVIQVHHNNISTSVLGTAQVHIPAEDELPYTFDVEVIIHRDRS